MLIPNDDSQKYLFCKLKLVVETLITQLNEPTNHNSLNPPKLLSQRLKNVIIKLLGPVQ